MRKNMQPSMLTKQVILDGLSYILRGGLRINNAHLPPAKHRVPNDFFGVCVASNSNPATDAYVINALRQLGIKNVRLDFSHDDLGNFTERFLQALIAEGLQITLHVLPPFAAAKNMESATEQALWKTFLETVLSRYAAQIYQIEIGNTINRKRWAGYSMAGFLSAWQIAHHAIKTHGVRLAGPNVQDFEPLYNINILNTLRAKNQLPDTHTNNLFVERVSEPERFDHRVFKYRWASVFKYNLVKKARTLQKIGRDFDVAQTASSAAFWAIYRIERLLTEGAQSQADYLTRYFTLLAASGALSSANWGALICHREGLIDDGLCDADYPALERIAHYKSADGDLNNYAARPSFAAMKTVIKQIAGAEYLGAIASANGLEIHSFNALQQVHVAWCINGKIAYLSQIYSENTLKSAKILHRDGAVLDKNIGLITETPIYLIWDADFKIELNPHNPKQPLAPAKALIIHAHHPHAQYFRFDEAGWQGLILAKDAAEAALLKAALHPAKLQAPQKADALRHARNAIWAIEDPRDSAHQLTIKQPIKMYPHKAFLDRFKPSKGKRSWNGAMQLLRHGVATAPPVAYFEKTDDTSCKQNFYVCALVKADCNIGQIFSAFAKNEPYLNLTPDEVYPQLAQFCEHMHIHRIHFRDLSGGNILVNILPDKKLAFSLIDTARLRSYAPPLSMPMRIGDMTRVCHKLPWPARVRFMQIYLGLSGRKFTQAHRLQFHLYDLKVWLKRTIGRKGIKKLMQRIKGGA